MKNFDPYKRTILFFASMINVCMMTALFSYSWYHFYADMMYTYRFYRRGNYVVLALYAVLLFFFSNMYGSLKIGRFRRIEVLLSQYLSLFLTNVVMYVVISLLAFRFVKMFGDTKTNNMGWNQVQLKDIAEVRGRVGWKGYKKEDLREEGPLVLGATHLTDNGEIDLSVPVHLSKEKYEESPEIFLQKGDLIFTQRGNTIGKVGLIENDIGEATINPCVLILRPINIHPIYFKSYFVMDATKNDMWKLNSGSAQPMITQKGIGEYIMTVPPLELQNQFADFVKEVEKSKVAVQQALDKAQLLFDSLMQQYFG